MLAKLEMLLAKDETRHEMFYEHKTKDCLDAEPELMPLVIESLKEFGMPGAYLVDDYGERRKAMEQAAFPTLADKKAAFVRLFSKMTRIIGHENTMQRLHRRQLPLGRRRRRLRQEDAPGDDHPPPDPAIGVDSARYPCPPELFTPARRLNR